MIRSLFHDGHVPAEAGVKGGLASRQFFPIGVPGRVFCGDADSSLGARIVRIVLKMEIKPWMSSMLVVNVPGMVIGSHSFSSALDVLLA